MRNSNLIGILVGSVLIITGISIGIWVAVDKIVPQVIYGTFATSEEFPIEYSKPNVFVDFNGITASLHVEADMMDSGNLVDIDTTVKGPEELEYMYPNETNYWDITTDSNGSYFVNFIVIDPFDNNHSRINYDIYMVVDYRANLTFDLQTITGDITIITERPTNLELITMATTTGSILVDLYTGTSVNGDGIFETTTGDITFSCSQDVYLEFDTFLCDTTTGEIYVELHQNTVFNTSSFQLETITGDVDFVTFDSVQLIVTDLSAQTITGDIYFDFNEIMFSNSSDIDLAVTTGDIDISWSQSSILTNHNITAIVATGNIDVLLDFNSNIGTQFYYSVGTGRITQTSNTVSQAGMGQFVFSLNTGTGNIHTSRT